MEPARLACAACGWTPGPIEVDPYPFRCRNAGTDDLDHVVTGSWFLVPGSSCEPRTGNSHREPGTRNQEPDTNPFIRYRTSLYSWHVARSRGMSDADYVAMVEHLDAAIARVAGPGFRTTPLARSDHLSLARGLDQPGGVWVKDETGNVSGSHKARHLMGLALYLEVLRRLGVDREGPRPLAVASCGNAALAAAVVARAIDRTLLVFVPDHASPAVVATLKELGAIVTACARTSDAGDPSYLAFRCAVADGALPFSCQGNENGLVIEGGSTLGYEIVDQVACLQARADATIDRVFIQVGGGALASACVRAFAHCVAAGRLAAMPRIHAVQARGGHPLKRAYDRVVDVLSERLAASSRNVPAVFASASDRAAYLHRVADPALIADTLAYARSHRSEFMWPWETEPRSIAGGILDDEVYDWAAVVEGMVRSGGFPIVVDEATLQEANVQGRSATGLDVDHTGTAGFAGLVALSRSLDKPRPSERLVVLFTGARRG